MLIHSFAVKGTLIISDPFRVVDCWGFLNPGRCLNAVRLRKRFNCKYVIHCRRDVRLRRLGRTKEILPVKQNGVNIQHPHFGHTFQFIYIMCSPARASPGSTKECKALPAGLQPFHLFIPGTGSSNALFQGNLLPVAQILCSFFRAAGPC